MKNEEVMSPAEWKKSINFVNVGVTQNELMQKYAEYVLSVKPKTPEKELPNKLPPLIQKLVEAIDQHGLKIQFGLVQQGHIPYIEETINAKGWNYDTWKEIGKHIGWDALTASCYYYDYINRAGIVKHLKIKQDEK